MASQYVFLQLPLLMLLLMLIHRSEAQIYQFNIIKQEVEVAGGFVHPAVFADRSGSQLTLRSKHTLEPETVLLKIPMSVSINLKILRNSPWGQVLKNSPFDGSAVTAYYIALDAKRAKKASELHVSLRNTPDQCWDGSDIAEALEGSPGAFPRGAFDLAAFQEDHAKFLYVDGAWTGAKVEYKEFCWGMCIVRSRSFDVFEGARDTYGSSVQLPLADLLNHSNEPNVYFTMSSDGKYFLFVTEIDVVQGQELQLSYVDCRPPQSMLTRYGFFQKDHCFAVMIDNHALEYDQRFSDIRFLYAGYNAPTYSQWDHLETVEKIVALCSATLELYPKTLGASVTPLPIEDLEWFRVASRAFLEECIEVSEARVATLKARQKRYAKEDL